MRRSGRCEAAMNGAPKKNLRHRKKISLRRSIVAARDDAATIAKRLAPPSRDDRRRFAGAIDVPSPPSDVLE
jgi:hypothetical protein